MSGSRILALDYGTKRIGVALSDELGWTAQPLETFERRTLDRDVTHIASLVNTHEVGQVVLGFPLQLDGREGPAVQAMREFAVRLEQGLSVPLVLWDERLTTKAAEDLLIAADVEPEETQGSWLIAWPPRFSFRAIWRAAKRRYHKPEWQESQFGRTHGAHYS